MPRVQNASNVWCATLDLSGKMTSKRRRVDHLSYMGKTDAWLAVVSELAGRRSLGSGLSNGGIDYWAHAVDDCFPIGIVGGLVAQANVPVQYAPYEMVQFSISPIMRVAKRTTLGCRHTRCKRVANADALLRTCAEECPR